MKFTEAQVNEIVGVYTDSVNSGADYDERTEVVKELAETLDASVPQVRGKLVAEKVYVGKPKADAKASKGLDKEALLGAIEICFGVEMPSMKNMSKKDIEALWTNFNRMSDKFNLNE